MKHIRKQAPPAAWQAFMGQLSETERQDWGSLTSGARDTLQKTLLAEQGHICCYCGVRISLERGFVLEHLASRDHHPQRTFDYENLLASCQGGANPTYHRVQPVDTIGQILTTYSITLEELLAWNPGVDPSDLKSGEKLQVNLVEKPAETHCDKHKGSNEIPITPLMASCEQAFVYDSLTGKVSPRAQALPAQQTIDKLGLNAAPLVRQRNREIRKKWSKLDLHSLNQSELNQLIKGFYTPDESGKLTPYCQVIVALLRDELLLRRKLADPDE